MGLLEAIAADLNAPGNETAMHGLNSMEKNEDLSQLRRALGEQHVYGRSRRMNPFKGLPNITSSQLI